jgi:hypothetical protein
MGQPSGGLDEFNQMLARPVLALIAEYAAALTATQAIANELGVLAARISAGAGQQSSLPSLAPRAKPQATAPRPAESQEVASAAASEAPSSNNPNRDADERSMPSARSVEVTIAMESLADIETFEAALQSVPAVQRITVERLEHGTAVLKLECRKGAPPPTVICTRCGVVLTRGGRAISHGLCADCAAAATASLR